MSGISDPFFSKGDVMRRLDAIERAIQDIHFARTLDNASIHGLGESRGIKVADDGAIRSASFDGDSKNIVGNPGTDGWCLGADGLVANNGVFRGEVRSANFVEGEDGFRLTPDGDAEFNEITLRDGIVGPSALAEQLQVVQHQASFGPTTLDAETTVMSVSVAVPPWAATAAVSAHCYAGADQLAGDPQDRRFLLRIDGVEGEPGQGSAIPAGQARILTSLGTSFPVVTIFRPFDTPTEDFSCRGHMIVQSIFVS